MFHLNRFGDVNRSVEGGATWTSVSQPLSAAGCLFVWIAEAPGGAGRCRSRELWVGFL